MTNFCGRWSFALALALAPTMVLAATPGPVSSKPADGAVEMDMFDAMAKGDVEVSFIPKDATKATVIFKNKTDKPVAIRLPDAFAGMPVLAQPGLFGPGGPGIGGPGVGSGGGRQSVGGSFPGGGGPFGGIMNVAPEKTRKIEVKTVCLEHGKKDPAPRVAYEIKPLEAFTDDAEIAKLVRLLGNSQITQTAAQAAAWHLTDELTWKELAQLNRVKLRSGYTEKWFSLGQLAAAQQIVEAVSKSTENSTPPPTQENDSLSLQN